MHLVLFQTLNDWIAVAFVLIAGLCFGFALAPGGRRWREQFHAIESDFASYHVKAEEDLRVASRRIRDLESENARLVRDAQAAAVPAPVPAPAAPAPAPAPVVAPEAVAAAPVAEPIAAPAPPAPPAEPAPAPVPVAAAEPIVHEPSAEETHASYVQERDKHDLRHSVEAALAGAVIGAVADHVADMRDGHQDHGLLHNLGAGALGAVAGVVGEKIVDKIGDHSADKHEAAKEAHEDGH